MKTHNNFHCFDRGVAKQCGVNGALLMWNFRHWIDENIANNRNFHDGRYWTYQSMDALCKTFDYLTPNQIRTAVDKLVKGGYILKGNYNKSAYDRTTWYAITKAGYALFSDCGDANATVENPKSICEETQMEAVETANGSGLNHNSIRGTYNSPNNPTNNEQQMNVCAEPPKAPPAPPVPPVFRIPLNDNSLFDVTADMAAHWRELYPAVDVEQELRKIIGWCEANPQKRKTRNGVNRFVTSWLSREQDRGGTRNGAYQGGGYGQGGYYGNGNGSASGYDAAFGGDDGRAQREADAQRAIAEDAKWGIKSAF